MSRLYPFCEQIHLHVPNRVQAQDAARQERTAREILRRLADQPGLILADQVGMGKTFVAMAMAVSVALEDSQQRPVVVMVPPSLKEKWPRDFDVFRNHCLPPNMAEHVRADRQKQAVSRAVDFLKLLDDPPERRNAIVFVTHGAMSQGLSDPWVKLALIQKSIRGRWDVEELKRRLSRILGRLLYVSRIDREGPEFWEKLLNTHCSQWLKVLKSKDIDPEGDANSNTDDDPVPGSVSEVLDGLKASDTEEVYQCLMSIPVRQSDRFDERLRDARRLIDQQLKEFWKKCVQRLRLRLPLLVLDEAHHLKNAKTRLASLFQVDEAASDANEISRGPLAGVFERMLFLTATPFQLGHAELCSVLDRFGGIDWQGAAAPICGREGFAARIKDLRAALDAAQEAAVTLDYAWGKLRQNDLILNGRPYSSVEDWWQIVEGAAEFEGCSLNPSTSHVLDCYRRTRERMKHAEALLRPWVIRHARSPQLPEPHQGPRRRRLVGRAICMEGPAESSEDGIAVSGESLLPFLLAARATAHAPQSRPLFAEGLASSFEAFLHTREARKRADGQVTDTDDEPMETCNLTDGVRWYLERLDEFLPRNDSAAFAGHPKIRATVDRVVAAWEAREKSVVFCHYIATGRALRQRISEEIERWIYRRGAGKLGCAESETPGELDRLSRRFFDEDSPVRRACDQSSSEILDGFPELAANRDDLSEIVRRNVRTPAFLVRFFPLTGERLTADAMAEAFDTWDQSGLTPRQLFQHFFEFLRDQCSDRQRRDYIEAIQGIQTGTHYGKDVAAAFSSDELQGERPERLIPNVRLVNGTTASPTRQRLMLAFNTPFAPEVLIASSVMAEGVDLHLNCRYVIHHDLCWNPSTLEQRTGRIDRIGAKVERCGQAIQMYLPYIAETQDEKMYRVVMDRERWFSVVMGEEYRLDARTTDKLAQRIPLPESAAAELAFRLEVEDTKTCDCFEYSPTSESAV